MLLVLSMATNFCECMPTQHALTWLLMASAVQLLCFHRWFLVTLPAVIESGSDAKLCAILLKPNESLTMTVSLLDDKNMTTPLVQQSSASAAIYRCFRFQVYTLSCYT